MTQTIWNRGIINYLVLSSPVQVKLTLLATQSASHQKLPDKIPVIYWSTQLILLSDWSKPQGMLKLLAWCPPCHEFLSSCEVMIRTLTVTPGTVLELNIMSRIQVIYDSSRYADKTKQRTTQNILLPYGERMNLIIS